MITMTQRLRGIDWSNKCLGLPLNVSMAFVFGVPLGNEIYTWPVAFEYL